MLFDSNDVINRWVEHVTELYHDERGDPPDASIQNGCILLPPPCSKLRCAGGREFDPRPGQYSRMSFSSDPGDWYGFLI